MRGGPAFDQAVERAIRALPPHFRDHLENVAFLVEEWPDAATLADLECDSPYDLLGLYSGWPITERGSDYAGALPDTIHIYRQPILAYCAETGEPIPVCIAQTVIHEVGHYYGFSDEEMEAIKDECAWGSDSPHGAP